MVYDIVGAKGTITNIDDTLVKLKYLDKEHNVNIQLLDARFIYGSDHLKSAIFHAKRSFNTNTNLASNMGIEIMLYASSERQIRLAIEKIGIKNDCNEFGLVIYSQLDIDLPSKLAEIRNLVLSELKLTRDDSVLDGDRDVLLRFGISEQEIETVPESSWKNLVLSKVAMLDIIK